MIFVHPLNERAAIEGILLKPGECTQEGDFYNSPTTHSWEPYPIPGTIIAEHNMLTIVRPTYQGPSPNIERFV